MSRSSLQRYAWLSIAAAIATIGLKSLAYWLTGSVGLLSDAVESLVNLVGAVMALAMLTIAARPPDEDHPHGYSKAEYFSSGIEGTLIFIAAISIAVAASQRLIHPQPIGQTATGIIISLLATLINLVVARILLRVGKAANSITLEADGHHLMTDVWTSAGVIGGIAVVGFTGWQVLDPLLALAVAVNILWTGFQLMRRSILGLLDRALPMGEREVVLEIFERYKQRGVDYHALRTRQAGARRFVTAHVLVPGNWSVQRGHQLLEEIEQEIRDALADVSVLIHLEPVEDPVSWEDIELDR
jgi:cation diffusion facilitator family transporter